MSPIANTPESMECRRRRRDVILAVLRSQSRPLAVSEVVDLVKELHGRGEWPAAPWRGARNEPYYTGINQTLRQMSWQGLVRCQDGPHPRGLWRTTLYWAPTVEQLMPDAQWAQPLLDAWTARTGLEVAVGVVHDDLVRFIDISTKRGSAWTELAPEQSWEDAFREHGFV